MLPRAGAPGPQRGSGVDAVATMIAGKGTGRLNGRPREAGDGVDADRERSSGIAVRPARGLPDLEPDVGRRVPPDPPLHAVPEDADEGAFEVSHVGDARSGVLHAGPPSLADLTPGEQVEAPPCRPPDDGLDPPRRVACHYRTPQCPRPSAGSRSKPAAARRPPRRAREAAARRPAPPPLEEAPVCSPHRSGRARSCRRRRVTRGCSTPTTISARPGPARTNPAARLRRPGEEVQGEEAVHDVCAGSRIAGST